MDVTRCFILLSILVAALAGCGWIDGLRGKRKVPLAGERIPIMLYQQDLAPDPRVADLRVMLPPPRLNDSWAQAGGNAAHAMQHLKISAQVAGAWERGIGDGSSDERRLLAQPIVIGNLIVSMDVEFQVTAFDIESGTVVWAFDPKVPDDAAETFGGGLAYDDGRIFMATGFGQIIAIRAQDGVELWRRPLPGPSRAAPTAGGGRIYAITIDNQTVALSAADGKKIWSHAGIAESAGLLGGGSPALAGNTVIVPYSSGELFALRVANGRVAWSDNLITTRRTDTLSTVAHIRGHPVVDRGLVYAVSHSGRLVAIDLRTGARVWDRGIGGSETPWVAGNFVYVISNQGDLYCLTRLGGRVRWVQPLPRYEDPEDRDGPIKWFGPVLASDRLLITGSHGEVLTLSPYTGRYLGRLELADRFAMPPIVASGRLIFLSDEADLIVYR